MKKLFVPALIALASPACAQTPCGPHDRMAMVLARDFDEHAIGHGLVAETHLVEVFTSAKGTWTILVTDTAGRACITGAGEAWQALHETNKGDPT